MTEIAIRQKFFLSDLTAAMRTFVKTCIHCISRTGGCRVQRPFGPALHEAIDLLQFDFIEIAPSQSGFEYILMLRNDFSSYCCLFPFESANAENEADAILEWSNAFTVPRGLISDGGTYF